MQGIYSPPSSPPLSATTTVKPSSGSNFTARRRGATYTIAGECERLFCEILRSVFLVEGNTEWQDSLALDKHSSAINYNDTEISGGVSVTRHGAQHGLGLQPFGSIEQRGVVTAWCKVYDYVGGALFRCFIVEEDNGERAMFVFFNDDVNGSDLKPGLMALLELCSVPGVLCDTLIVCLDRSAHSSDGSLMRSLGWVGFEPTTLEKWTKNIDIVSPRWMFMGMEV
ncbi:hypothetical protein EJ05DRAFT_169050 [Pseudovirgaria hyperparasitica]|uniref:Ornithine decarboxylase antizyme n=1 Tax=Pseudovirgaria hyperparasitica TaxID=470096 RepID=A0A6A6VWT4_9PEZI|nr:uncharacterized protein EJ05DRAFT_169050 [Pseudovirgaria hyperparasitica]KAF2753701.1 hypothetical protein EJ05DRAFT_169050 [Pseudovirgaria hyperparasitica]